MTDEKLSQVFPDTFEIPLRKGKLAIVGPITLRIVLWANEQFGSFEELAAKVFDKSEAAKHLPELMQLIYQMVENKDEVGTFEEFTELVVPSKIFDIMEGIENLARASSPDRKSIKGAPKGKKSVGASSSASLP